MPRWKALPEELDPEIREFAGQMRQLVDRSGLGLAAVSDRTGYSKTSWERYLNGRLLPPQGAVSALAEVTGTDVRHLATMWELAERAWSRAEMRHDMTMEAIRISQAREALAGAAQDAPERRKPRGWEKARAAKPEKADPAAPGRDVEPPAAPPRAPRPAPSVAATQREKPAQRDEPYAAAKSTDDASSVRFGKPAGDPFAKPADDPFTRPADDPFANPKDSPFDFLPGADRDGDRSEGRSTEPADRPTAILSSDDVKSAGPRDAGPRDAASHGAGLHDAGPRDAGPRDSASRDAAPRDAGTGARAPQDRVEWGARLSGAPARAPEGFESTTVLRRQSPQPDRPTAEPVVGAVAASGATGLAGGPPDRPGPPVPGGGGGGQPSKGRRLAMVLAGAVGALAVVGAAVFFLDTGGSSTASPDPKPSPTETGPPLPEGVKCSGADCAGEDPELMGCGGQYAETTSDAMVGSAYIEVRYSDVCKAAWARIGGAAPGTTVTVDSAGKSEDDEVTDASGGYTKMVAAKNAKAAKACVETAGGATGCTTP